MIDDSAAVTVSPETRDLALLITPRYRCAACAAWPLRANHQKIETGFKDIADTYQSHAKSSFFRVVNRRTRSCCCLRCRESDRSLETRVGRLYFCLQLFTKFSSLTSGNSLRGAGFGGECLGSATVWRDNENALLQQVRRSLQGVLQKGLS